MRTIKTYSKGAPFYIASSCWNVADRRVALPLVFVWSLANDCINHSKLGPLVQRSARIVASYWTTTLCFGL
jgi:hypothetical protein